MTEDAYLHGYLNFYLPAEHVSTARERLLAVARREIGLRPSEEWDLPVEPALAVTNLLYLLTGGGLDVSGFLAVELDGDDVVLTRADGEGTLVQLLRALQPLAGLVRPQRCQIDLGEPVHGRIRLTFDASTTLGIETCQVELREIQTDWITL